MKEFNYKGTTLPAFINLYLVLVFAPLNFGQPFNPLPR